MPLCDWEKTITCPYNPSHQITVERIQFHLVKCRKNHPQSDNVICPYNASHHIPKPEEQYHIARCPDRKIVEMAKYSWALDKEHGNLSRPKISHVNRERNPLLDDGEDWEKEATIKVSYDPKKKATEKNVLRKLEGATPSQRNEFRANERYRLGQMQQAQAQAQEKKAGNGKLASLAVNTSSETVKPLRRPVLGLNNHLGNPLLVQHMGRGRPLLREDSVVSVGASGLGKEWGREFDGQLGTGGLRRGWEQASTTTRESLNTSTDTLDLNLRALSLGRGHYIARRSGALAPK